MRTAQTAATERGKAETRINRMEEKEKRGKNKRCEKNDACWIISKSDMTSFDNHSFVIINSRLSNTHCASYHYHVRLLFGPTWANRVQVEWNFPNKFTDWARIVKLWLNDNDFLSLFHEEITAWRWEKHCSHTRSSDLLISQGFYGAQKPKIRLFYSTCFWRQAYPIYKSVARNISEHNTHIHTHKHSCTIASI